MKNRILLKGVVIMLTAAAFMATACYMPDTSIDVAGPGFTSGTVTTLTLDTYADGDIASTNGEQWFKFTATASTQYITISYGTLTAVYIQLYDSTGQTISDRYHCDLNPGYGGTYLTQTVTRGRVYYIKVTPYSGNGTYRMMFSNSNLTPEERAEAVVLTYADWTGGAATAEDRGQVFKFTAYARDGTQYFHINFGTLTNLMVRIYDSTGIVLDGAEYDKHLTGNSDTRAYWSRTLRDRQEYYITVWPYSKTDSGTYWIGFNTWNLQPILDGVPQQHGDDDEALPSVVVKAIELTPDIWTDGAFTTDKRVQWFKFTATSGYTWIHATFGTLSRLNIRYDYGPFIATSALSASRSAKYLSDLTAGTVYYICVSPVDSSEQGTYQLAFKESSYLD
jgi:hypothetical protein